MQETNPFILNFRLTFLQVNKGYTLTPNYKNAEGSVPKGMSIPIPFFVEREDKTSLFHTKDIMNVLFKGMVRSIGRDVLVYISYNLKKGKDWIKFDYDKACEELDISRSTLYVGLEQLTKAGIIQKKDVRVYWINPVFLFNGDRIKYFRELGPEYYDIIEVAG